MANRNFKLLGTSLLLFGLAGGYCHLQAQQAQHHIVRVAELEIDPAQLDTYKAALKEEIEASIRIEPGVLTLYAVTLKDQPTQIRIFETYADIAAYNSHLETPHFKKYKSATQGMVKSLRLFEAEPIVLGAKSK